MATTINCTVCGKLTDSRLDSCPHCGAYLKRKRDAARAQSATGQRKSCPQCRALVEEGDIICVACGTNLLTGQKVVQEAARGARSSSTPWIIAGSVAALVVIVAGVFWVISSSGDPVTRALRLIDDREYLEAQSVLAEYVTSVQDDPRAYYELGRLQWRASQYPSAAESFASAVDLDPSNVDAALWAVVSLSQGDIGGSARRQIDYLERALTYESGDPVLWYLLAVTRGVSGDAAGQIEALEKVIELRPTDDSARWSIGLAHALNGKYREARNELALVGEGLRSADALALRGFVANLEGSSEAATRHLEASVLVEGSTVAWRAYSELGKLSMLRGEFQDAQSYLEQALSLNQNSGYTRYLRAICLEARGRFQDALSEFEAVSRDRSEYAADASVGSARVYLAMKMPERALSSIEQAGRLGAEGASYHTVRGKLRMGDEDYAGAATSFGRAIDSDPRYGAAYLERGLLHVRNEDLVRGLKDLERYLELLGSNVRGTRAADIRALTDQLRQASDSGGRRRGSRSGGRR